MTRHDPKRPTDAELEILRVLWLRGPSTVREVFEALREERNLGYTTILKQLQIMTEKGHVVRDESVRPQVFRPKRSEKHTQKQLLSDLLERVFSGDPAKLVLQALTLEKATPEERDQIRQLLDDLEERSR